ncbi:Histidine phosphatase superfamily, clade-2 [Penicillium expansum]|nr:Histidine phosphatase superfamily, clade-2 [Penicillium expansum]
MKNFIGATLVTAAVTATASRTSAPAPGPTGSSYASGFDMTASWANLSPYKDADSFGLPSGVPQGCELSQVHVLHRHAQRFPTDYPLDGEGMTDFAAKLTNYSKAHPNKTVALGPLKFLNNWDYVIGQDILMENGAATEATSGANFWIKYGRLLYRAGRENAAAWSSSLNVYANGTDRPTPVFRTTSQARILESARWWLSGFFGNSGANSSYDQYNLVVIPEQADFNNTLASYETCTFDYSEGDNAAEVFISRYTKHARTRLSAYFPRDFNLTSMDVLAMQNLCVYESTSLGGSSFCSLFTEQEWKDFEYNVDVQYYGDYAYGSPSGRAQGIGYVLELAARLEEKLINSSDTSINYTYTNNEAQFPFGQPFYMDMSHDDIILSVINALGFDYFKYGPKGLPVHIDHAPERNFSLSQMTPFGARFISEIWTCPRDVSFDDLDPVLYANPTIMSTTNTTKYIRFVLNNSPVPQDGLIGCEDSSNGFCHLDKFLSGIPTLKDKAQFQKACFGNYTTGSQVGDGAPES